MSEKEWKWVENWAGTLVLTAVSPLISNSIQDAILHSLLGVMVENGSDLTENRKTIEGSCTVRWILDIQAVGICSERSYICSWLARVAELTQALHTWSSGHALWPSALECWCIHSLSHLSSWLHQWNCSCS